MAANSRTFGPGSLIPNPFDPRLILRIAPAVAKAAMDSGVATRPISDFATYQERLNRFVFRSGFIMKPVFERAKQQIKRVIYAEGEDERMLRATQVVVEEGLARPILIGRPAIVEARLERFGLSIRPGRDFELINPDDDPRYRTFVQALVDTMGRKGTTPDAARTLVRTNATVIAALAMKQGLADAMICGLEGRYMAHLRFIRDIIGLAPGVGIFAALSTVITTKGVHFLADTHINGAPLRAKSPRWRSSPPRMCAASGSSRRSRWSRARTSAAMSANPAASCARRSILSWQRHPSWRSTAR